MTNPAALPPWTCPKCQQLNSGWSAECGRCESVMDNSGGQTGPSYWRLAYRVVELEAELAYKKAYYAQFDLVPKASPAQRRFRAWING